MNIKQLPRWIALATLLLLLVSLGHAQNGSFTDLNASGTITAGKIVVGAYSSATGNQANAIGADANAPGAESFAIGNSGAMGNFSISLGGYAHGVESWILGNSYTGPQAIEATAIGYHTSAFASASTAIGFYATAQGDASSALGNWVTAQGAYQTVVGCWNLPKASADGYVRSTDPVFIVGNGYVWSEIASPSNAFEIYWNGDAWLQGTLSTNGVRTPPKGDLSMGSFTTGSTP